MENESPRGAPTTTSGPPKDTAEEAATLQCCATTTRGAPCKRTALAGSSYCSTHIHLIKTRTASRKQTSDEFQKLYRDVEHRLTSILESVYHGVGMPFPTGEFQTRLWEFVRRVLPKDQDRLVGKMTAALSSDYLNPDTWRGLWMVIRQGLEEWAEMRSRRRRGDFEVDDYGFDEDFYHSLRILSQFFYKYWFRVRATGVDNVPSDGRVLLVCNHSGVLPLDGAMISEAIWTEHPSPRVVRWLFLKWFVGLPFAGPLMNKVGCVLACPENGERMLEEDRMVGVFPEGLKGIGKLYRDRYKLARFGRGGFIKIAMKTRAPIVPVSVVGAEETYPALFYATFISKPLGLPYLPITPTFPLLGMLGIIPLPTKWHIHFGKPIRFKENAPLKANDYLVVSLLTDRVRNTIQEQIDQSLSQRKSIF